MRAASFFGDETAQICDEVFHDEIRLCDQA
jgi:hypothetical protein